VVKRVYWIGDTLNSWNTDFWPDGYAFDMAVFAEEHPVREAELNFIQQNAFIRLRHWLQRIVSDGWLLAGPFLFPQQANNQFQMAESWFGGAGYPVHVGTPGQPQNAATIQLPPPPATGSAYDLVYLEIWAQEVAAPQSTDQGGVNVTSRVIYQWGGVGNPTLPDQTWWSAAGIETARRVQIRWALRSARFTSAPQLQGVPAQGGASAPLAQYPFAPVSGSPCLYQAGDGSVTCGQALQAVDATSYATPVALVARTAGQSVIVPSAVTDLRVGATLQLPATTLTNGPFTPPALVNVSGAHFAYAGQQLAGYAPQQTGQQSSSAGFAATRLQLPAGAQPLAYLRTASGEQGFPANQTAVTRVGVTLQLVGQGAPVTVELRPDANGVPGSTVLASATIPASWLLPQPREVSFPILPVALQPQAFLWVVVRPSGTAASCAALLQAAASDPNHPGATSSDGINWTAAPGFACALYTGTQGALVNALDADLQAGYFFEYDGNGNVLRIAETLNAAGFPPYARMVTVYSDPQTGQILDLA
jgi:hypothetical protein